MKKIIILSITLFLLFNSLFLHAKTKDFVTAVLEWSGELNTVDNIEDLNTAFQNQCEALMGYNTTQLNQRELVLLFAWINRYFVRLGLIDNDESVEFLLTAPVGDVVNRYTSLALSLEETNASGLYIVSILSSLMKGENYKDGIMNSIKKVKEMNNKK